MSVEGPAMPVPYGIVAPPGTASATAPHPAPGTALATAPEPPPGPGVAPPFVSPPTDGTRQRRWLAVGLAGGAALLLCVGGLFGLGALVVFGSQMVTQQSQAAVTTYLNAIKAEDYEAAYDSICPAAQSKISKREFLLVYGLRPGIESFTVGQPEVTDTIVVPAAIRYTDGTSQTVRYLVEQDPTTSDFQVCGEVD